MRKHLMDMSTAMDMCLGMALSVWEADLVPRLLDELLARDET